jgi:FkbM family methyltransferase
MNDWTERAKTSIRGTPFERPLKAVWRRLKPAEEPTLVARQEVAYDAQLIEVLRRILSLKSNCIDVGAHRGKFVEPIVELAPHGHHMVFEPLPACAAFLRQRFPQVEVREQAVAEATGRASFRSVPGDAAQNSGFDRRPWDNYPEAGVELIEVEVVRLDDVVPSDREIRFVKIDVEGAELRVLQGARSLLARDRPIVAWEHGGHDREIFDLLHAEEFGVFLLEDWLSGRPALEWDAFEAARRTEWFFLADSGRALIHRRL